MIDADAAAHDVKRRVLHRERGMAYRDIANMPVTPARRLLIFPARQLSA